ncbi:MAG: two-component sensor histidine kinase [Acidimicrobiia bacterium]|nr:two-component sensor histidine kinase [Acidimicrobiia bacterium]MYC86336.1 two-component sensor histidine kinase [Acidimicrobiia bacterium]
MASLLPPAARRIGRALARWVTTASLVAAGIAAVGAPQPWPWVGIVAMVLGVVSGMLQHRISRHERGVAETLIEELEVDRLEARTIQDLYGSLLSSLPVGVVAVQAGQAVYANPAAVEVLGERVTQAGAPMPGAVREVIDGAVAGRSSSARFSQGLPRRVMEVAARPVGEGLVLLHLSDITERSRIDRMRQDFVIAASHELKTPVAAIRAAAETVLMALEEDHDVVASFSGRILDNAVRMSRTVSDLLDLSRLESGILPFEACDLAEVVGEVVERFLTARPSIEWDAEPTPVMGSPSYLALACRNLLENAVHHTPDDGLIRVTIGAADGEAIVVVTDNGTGIPSDELPRIFERFYRVDEARSRATGGTGLGLAIVKHVADLHDGRIEVESRLGRGSTFRFRIPVRPPP